MGQGTFIITKRIEIDAAHRVPGHLGKCRGLHGHRYVVEAQCEGTLADQGSESGMVLDFGFLKEELIDVVDSQCDHSMILWIKDPLAQLMCSVSVRMERNVSELGYHAVQTDFGQIYLIATVPTAENLAEHWFSRLVGRVFARSGGRAKLVALRVWETPTASAIYAEADGNIRAY